MSEKRLSYTTRNIPGETVIYPHISTSDVDFKFDFGSDCPIFATRMRTLVLRNMSSCTSNFKIWVNKYSATDLMESAYDLNANSELMASSHDNYLLTPTKRSKLGFSSKSGQSYVNNILKVRKMIQQMQELLGDGRGAAFSPTPHEGTIGPWEEIRVEIVSYNNLVIICISFLGGCVR
jgi:hypothetical protein